MTVGADERTHGSAVAVRYRLLGPVELAGRRSSVPLPGVKPRLLLAALALRPNTVVSAEQLADVLWDGAPPASARANLRNYATTLRRVLDRGELTSRFGGYHLSAGPGEVDVDVFTEEVRHGRRALAEGRAETACTHLRRALAMWRGPAGEGLPPTGALSGRLTALDEQRLLAEEDLIEAELAVGRHVEQVGVIRQRLTEHPLRERLWAALVLALYRCGDVGAALCAYGEARNRLAEGLGLAPGPWLQQLHAAVLKRGPGLVAPPANTIGNPFVSTTSPLPRPVELVGRDSEVEAVVRALYEPSSDGLRLLIVHGPLGAGKSAVALRAAHLAASHFPDGQLYLDLRRCPVEEAVRRLRQSPGKRLVLLDHCTSSAELRTLPANSPDCAFVVTADSPLAATDAVTRTFVGRLSTADAVAMLARTIGQDQVDREPEAAAALVALCDHLPLAVRAAAAVLIDQTGTHLADLVHRLGDDTHLLDELVIDDLDVRKRVLARYRALSAVDPIAAAAFRRAGTDCSALPPVVARRLADYGLAEEGRPGPLVRLVAAELSTCA